MQRLPLERGGVLHTAHLAGRWTRREPKRHPAGTERHKDGRELGAANQAPGIDLFLDFTK